MSIYKTGIWKHTGTPNPNILPYSDFSNIVDNEYVFIDTSKTFNGAPTIKITANGFTSNSYKGWNSVNLKNYLTPGAKYTVSIWVYVPSNNGIDIGWEWRMYQKYNNGNSTDWTGFYPSVSSVPKDTWVKYSKVYTVRDDMTAAYFNMNVIRNGTYWISKPKIEAGEIATSYVPNSIDSIYVGDTHGFIEYNDKARIQKKDYIEANGFFEI